MPRAYCLLALIVLPAFSGCTTSTSRSSPPALAANPYAPPECCPAVAAPQPASVPYPAAQPTPQPSTPAVPPPASSLVVANVHKEPVSIYTVRGGQLAFVAQVPPGEAVDIAVSPGARLAATFSLAPHCVNYAATGQVGEVWLLRPVPVVPACQACLAAPGQPATRQGVGY